MPSSDDCATLTAYIRAVDHTAKEAEARWGMDRLGMLVPPDLLAKFLRQVDRYRAALEEAWAAKMLTRAQLDAVIARSGAMQRGYEALEAAASEAGHRPIVADVWEARLRDGTVVAIVRTNAEAAAVQADGRHLVVYTLAEVANVIDAIPTALQLAKQAFPGSKIQAPAAVFDRSWVKNGDDLPEILGGPTQANAMEFS